MKKQIQTKNAPSAIGPYSQAIQTTGTGGLLFVSGQIPLDPTSGELVLGDITAQTKRVMDNLKAIIEAAGGNLSQVVRTTIFLKDMGNFGKVNEVYGTYFAAPYPARATVEVARLPRDVAVEIDAIVQLG